jgi:hypothetical protein
MTYSKCQRFVVNESSRPTRNAAVICPPTAMTSSQADPTDGRLRGATIKSNAVNSRLCDSVLTGSAGAHNQGVARSMSTRASQTRLAGGVPACRSLLAMPVKRLKAWTITAALVLVAFPVVMGSAVSAQSIDRAAWTRAVTFLSIAGRGHEVLKWMYPFAEYKGFDCPASDRLPQGAFVVHCRIDWTTIGDGYTKIAFRFNASGRFTGTDVEDTNALVPLFAINSYVIRSAGQLLIDHNKDKLTTLQQEVLRWAIREADAKSVMDISLSLEQ